MFARSRQNSLTIVPALFFCIFLLIGDCHYHRLDKLRASFSLVMSPLQYAVDYPVRVIGWLRAMVGSKHDLIRENMELRYQQTILDAQLQRLLVLKKENSQLKALLQTSTHANMKFMAAELLAVEASRARQLLVLNKGLRDGVFIGQAVLDAKGVMGQIIDVGLLSSTVLLISDAKCAVPVRNNRTGERAILVGTNDMSQLELINLPKSSAIQKGDLLVTSGLGRRYPEGYPVGRVVDVKNIPGDEFIKVTVSPMAKLNRSRLALLIWPDETQATMTAQVNERMAVVSEMK